MYSNTGTLLATEQEVYNFLRALENKEIGCTSYEPPISHVLDGRATYKLTRGKTDLSFGYAHKYLSALNEIYVH